MRSHGVIRWIVLTVLAGALTPAAWLSPARGAVSPGRWEGTITLPTGPLEFSVEFSRDAGSKPTATLSIPMQAVHDALLTGVVFSDRAVSFTFADAGASFTGVLNKAGDAIEGALDQAGQSFPFTLRRVKEAPAAPAPFIPTPIERVPQRWRGVTALPGVNLEFMITFTPDPAGDGWTGTVDIPLQGVAGLPLRDVQFGAKEIKFTIQSDRTGAPPPAIFSLHRTAMDKAVGTFNQAGSELRVSLHRVTDPNETVELPRPQTPKPPFPYTEREVHYPSPVDGAAIAGTLTIPDSDGPHPVVLFITGSGAQDRDETIAGHKPFWVIADDLARRGVASLRVDDRGVGGSGGDTLATTSDTNIRDILAGVAYLKSQPEIDPKKIGLIGHSEGAWLAPMAAARSSDVAFLVLLAPPGVTGRELLLMQRDRIRKTVGVPDEQLALEHAKHAALLDAVERGAPDGEIDDALRQLALTERAGAPDAEQYAEHIVKTQGPMVRSAWFRDVLRLDSRPALRKLRIPVLAMIGSLDLQVPADPNLNEIRGALDSAGNTHATVVLMPDLNHLLQRARKGLMSEYLMIQQTISPDALNRIGKWVAGVTHAHPPDGDADD